MKFPCYSIVIAMVAFTGIVPAINPASARTSTVAAHGRENVTKSKPLPSVRRTKATRAPLRETAQCAPDDRKCEVEQKLKAQVHDSSF